MASVSEIRSLVSNYLVGSIDLSVFAREFSVLFYDIEDGGDQEAISLSYRIESELAKQSNGLISSQVLRSSILTLMVTGTSQQVVFEPVEVKPSPICVSESGNAKADYHEVSPIYGIAAVA